VKLVSELATIEEEVRQAKEAEIAAFEMPRPARASRAWYPGGSKATPAETAFVLRVGRRNIEVQRASGTRWKACGTSNDPKLQLSADSGPRSAWDFTDSDKQRGADTKRIDDWKASSRAHRAADAGRTVQRAEEKEA
jgi:hypothetical protein